VDVFRRKCRVARVPSTFHTRTAPDPQMVPEAAASWSEAARPSSMQGKGALRAGMAAASGAGGAAGAPVVTSLEGRAPFRRRIRSRRARGGRSIRKRSFTSCRMPTRFSVSGAASRRATSQRHTEGEDRHSRNAGSADLNKNVIATLGLVGDAGLVLDALLQEVRRPLTESPEVGSAPWRRRFDDQTEC